MNRSTLLWTILMLAGGGFLVARAVVGAGSVYVQRVEATVDTDSGSYDVVQQYPVPPRQRNEPGVVLSPSRTVGIWVAGLLSLCVFSFLYRDNVFYKVAESLFVGSSAAYAMVVGFWSELVPNLVGNLAPSLLRNTVMPGIPEDQAFQPIYLIPLGLGVLMLWRLAPSGAWIARWPLAFFIGATAGIRLVAYFESDFVTQIQSTILPLLVFADGSFSLSQSLKNITIVTGVLTSLVYFFFSFEHSGPVHYVSRVGILFLMITFGASFGTTVMGRITLLSQRIGFLVDDWLWIVDPLNMRS